MAEANTTIDPNDLDSIDALLDEAEFDLDEGATSEQSLPDIEDEPAPSEAEDQLGDIDFDMEDQSTSQDNDLNDMLGLDDEPEVSSALDAAPQSMAAPTSANKQSLNDNNADDFIARRTKASEQTDELTVEEMDSIKKMVMGFGIGLILLLIVAIVFAAMAAFSSGDNEVLEQQVTALKEETEIARVGVQSNEKMLRDLNRKVDALSFQVEQLSGDILAKNQTGQVVERGGVAPVASAPIAAASPQVVAQLSEGLETKVDSISRSLALAQRRIVEINNRVSSLQQQQGTVLKSVKDIEKNILEKQLEQTKQEAAVEEEVEVEQSPTANKPANYRYQAPAGLMYQPSSSGVYP